MEKQNNLEINEEISKQLKKFNINLEKYSESSDRLSKLLLIIAFIQVVIAIFQFMASFIFADNRTVWIGLFLEAILFIYISYIIREFSKDFFDKKKQKTKIVKERKENEK